MKTWTDIPPQEQATKGESFVFQDNYDLPPYRDDTLLRQETDPNTHEYPESGSPIDLSSFPSQGDNRESSSPIDLSSFSFQGDTGIDYPEEVDDSDDSGTEGRNYEDSVSMVDDDIWWEGDQGVQEEEEKEHVVLTSLQMCEGSTAWRKDVCTQVSLPSYNKSITQIWINGGEFQ